MRSLSSVHFALRLMSLSSAPLRLPLGGGGADDRVRGGDDGFVWACDCCEAIVCCEEV